MVQPQIPVSLGELLDKVSILMIKSKNIQDSTKLSNINKELQSLKDVCSSIPFDLTHPYFLELIEINKKLWNIEDEIREKEHKKEFDEHFINLARSVYITNDKRSDIKKKINVEFKSDLVEEKSHAKY